MKKAISLIPFCLILLIMCLIGQGETAKTFDTHGQTVVFYPLVDTQPVISWSGVLSQNGSGTPSVDNYRSFSSGLQLVKYEKNLIYPSLYTSSKGGLTWTINSDKSVSISGICTTSGAFNIMTRHLQKGIYRLQGSYGCGPVSIEVVDANGKSLGILTSDSRSKLIWIPKDGLYTVRYLHLPNANAIDAVSYPMLTAGTGRYEYEPYNAETISIHLPEYFGGGTVSSDGTITVTHYKVTLTKKSSLKKLNAPADDTQLFLLDDAIDKFAPAKDTQAAVSPVFCSALEVVSHDSMYQAGKAYTLAISENAQQLLIRLPFSSASKAKRWLGEMKESNTPVEIIYKLETPIVLERTDAFSVPCTQGANTISTSYGTIEAAGYEDQNYTAMKNRPVMTFVDDDGRSGSLDFLIKISEGADVAVSAALVTAYVNDATLSTYMNWSDISRLQTLGASFHSHTNSHIQLNTAVTQVNGVYAGKNVTLENIREDFTVSQAYLAENSCNTSILVYPHGALTHETASLVKEHFKGGVTITEGINELPIKPYKLLRYNLAKEQGGNQAKRTLADWKQLVDYCAASGGWLIWMTHGYSDNFSDAEINDIITLCQYAKDNGVEIMNLEDAFAYMNNQLTIGDMDSTDYYIIDRNGSVYTDRMQN